MTAPRKAGFRIVDLHSLGEAGRQQAAEVLVAAFRSGWPDAWPGLAEGLEEVDEALSAERIGRAAVDEHGCVLGWIGGIPSYRGRAWELHPLAVHPDLQRRGVGSALVRDFEELVRTSGALTIHLGSDDVNKMTNLWGTDLYPDVLQRLEKVRNLRGHPFTFYQKLGYVIVGAIPDANGFGRPDILMAKRIQKA